MLSARSNYGLRKNHDLTHTLNNIKPHKMHKTIALGKARINTSNSFPSWYRSPRVVNFGLVWYLKNAS